MTNNLLSTLGFARFTSRHKTAEAHLARVIQKHGKEGLVATGHSAGGLVAGHLGSRYGI
jgi:peptidase E